MYSMSNDLGLVNKSLVLECDVLNVFECVFIICIHVLRDGILFLMGYLLAFEILYILERFDWDFNIS